MLILTRYGSRFLLFPNLSTLAIIVLEACNNMDSCVAQRKFVVQILQTPLLRPKMPWSQPGDNDRKELQIQEPANEPLIMSDIAALIDSLEIHHT